MPNATGEPQSNFNKPNIGKSFKKFQAVMGMIIGIIILLIDLIIAAAVQSKSHKLKDTLIVLAIGAVFGLIPLLLSVLSLKQLKKPSNIPQNVSQFQSANQTDVKSTLGPATLTAGEKMLGWIGPISVHGKGFSSISYSVLDHEVDKNPFNTVLITDKQFLGIMFGPDDLSSVEGAGIRKLATEGINQLETGPTADKNIQFSALNAGKWGDIVAAATSSGLDSLVKNHLNFGLPYSSAESFKADTGLVNPGLEVNLKDGSKVKFVTMKKDQLAAVATSLAQYIKQA